MYLFINFLQAPSNGNDDEEDLDGAPLSDADGEDLDGVPLDGAALMKISQQRRPQVGASDDEDDIDGVPCTYILPLPPATSFALLVH